MKKGFIAIVLLILFVIMAFIFFMGYSSFSKTQPRGDMFKPLRDNLAKMGLGFKSTINAAVDRVKSPKKDRWDIKESMVGTPAQDIKTKKEPSISHRDPQFYSDTNKITTPGTKMNEFDDTSRLPKVDSSSLKIKSPSLQGSGGGLDLDSDFSMK